MKKSLLQIHECLKFRFKTCLSVVAVRRHVRVILLFSVLDPLFVLGWILYVVGGKQDNNNVAPTRKTKYNQESTANVLEIEMSLIEEIMEEYLTD
jgi:hypothetical protein